MKKYHSLILSAACVATLGVVACSEGDNRTWEAREYRGIPYTEERTAGTGFIYVLAELMEKKGAIVEPIMERTMMLVPELVPRLKQETTFKPLRSLKGGKGAKGMNGLYLLDDTRRLPEDNMDVNGEKELMDHPGVQEVWQRQDTPVIEVEETPDVIEPDDMDGITIDEVIEVPEGNTTGGGQTSFKTMSGDGKKKEDEPRLGINLPDLEFPKAEKVRKQGDEPLFEPRVSRQYH